VFVLVSDQPRRLLPTIRSRCTRVDIGLPPLDLATQWLAGQGVDDAANLLALSGGTPLDAQRWAESGELDERRSVLDALAAPQRIDPVTLGERLKGVSPQAWHNLVYKWLGDLLAARLRGSVQFNRDFADVLTRLGGKADLARLLALARMQASEGRVLSHPLNRALQIEAWLIQYRHVFD
jgi:DNA polymerase-3 subunit delta'